jgi:release factor glutamine methyltransferase
MATLRAIITDATEQLSAVSESPQLDAELLACHALIIDRARYLTRLDEECEPNAFSDLLARRMAHEPIAYILGEWEFFSMPLTVRPPTLVPRPETEHMVEWALELLPKSGGDLLDIGTGTGCIPIAILANSVSTRAIATDIKPHNLDLAAENAQRNGLIDRIQFIESDLFGNIDSGNSFDLICSNPPYIANGDWSTLSHDIRDFEDRDALLSGDDGLDHVRAIVIQAQDFLKPGAPLLLEIGAGQAESVSVLLAENGYNDISFRKDLAGIDRIAMGRKP